MQIQYSLAMITIFTGPELWGWGRQPERIGGRGWEVEEERVGSRSSMRAKIGKEIQNANFCHSLSFQIL